MNIRPHHDPADWMDSMGDWAVSHKAECGYCGGKCPAPQACQQPENLSGFPLEPYLTRHVWLGPLLIALIGFLWLCLDGYAANLP